MTTAYPLQWPDGWPRTRYRVSGDRFKQHGTRILAGTNVKTIGPITFAKARDKLYSELERLGAENFVISSNHKPDIRGVPIESKLKVADEGIAIYFQYLGKAMSMACDRFDTAAANMRSLGLAIEAMRQLERHGGGFMMERAFSGFEALPAPGTIHWTSILGVPRTARRSDIETAFRSKAKELHPDQGGSDAAMAELNLARDRALKEVAA